jgi:hypothetical protein
VAIAATSTMAPTTGSASLNFGSGSGAGGGAGCLVGFVVLVFVTVVCFVAVC